MLSTMIARLLFRAVLSLGMLLGIASYGHYLSGGDPGALWKKVAGRAFGGAGESFGELRGAVAAPVAALAGAGGGGGRRESVWTWRDENGVTHYATTRPAGIEADTVTVDPDVNVLAPVRAPEPRRVSADAAASGGAGGAEGGAMPRPGIAGALQRTRGDAPAADPAQAEAMLRMLQSPSR